MSVDITILVCTYRRAADLADLLESTAGQIGLEHITAEILVVDNNSSDATPQVVREAAGRSPLPVRYIFEGRQGKSFALNAGIAAAQGEIIAVTDDDQLMPPTYLIDLVRAFRAHPEAVVIGGKVLPLWEVTPPIWLTHDHWAPLGMADYGDRPLKVDSSQLICLLTCGFRRRVVLDAGGYRNDLSVSGNMIGGTEDADLLERLWKSGHHGMYLPHLVLMHKAPARRLTKAHFRRWHAGHGRFEARRRCSKQLRPLGSALFGIPLYIYRQALLDTWGIVLSTLRRDWGSQFRHELGLRFVGGFSRQCLRYYLKPVTAPPSSQSSSGLRADSPETP